VISARRMLVCTHHNLALLAEMKLVLALSLLACCQAIDVEDGSLIQLFLTKKLNLTTLLTPDLSAFDWGAAGPYTATGTISFAVTWPFTTNASAPTPVTLAVDPIHGYVTIDFSPRVQYVVSNGFYYVEGSDCYTTTNRPTNFSHYNLLYQQLRQTTVHLDLINGIVKTYTGLVIDPANGGEYGSYLIQTNQKNQVISYGFQQTIVQDYIGNSKVSGTMLFNQFKSGLPDKTWGILPTICHNATVQDYDAQFFPSSIYYNPYLV